MSPDPKSDQTDREPCNAATAQRFRRPWLYPSEHMAKAEVYQEFADTFSALVPVLGMKDKERKAREIKQRYMRLALVDPLVRDGLRSALEDADAYWSNA